MININQLKEFMGCDDPFLAHLMETFLKESGDGMVRLRTACDTKNWPVAKATAHKMLSSTRILNLEELTPILEEIEKIAEKATGTERIPEKVSILEQSWKNVIEEIKVLLQKLKG